MAKANVSMWLEQEVLSRSDNDTNTQVKKETVSDVFDEIPESACERIKELLDAKPTEYKFAGAKKIGGKAFVCAFRKKNDGSGYRANPTVWWFDEGILKPCVKSNKHAQKRRDVLAHLRDVGFIGKVSK